MTPDELLAKISLLEKQRSLLNIEVENLRQQYAAAISKFQKGDIIEWNHRGVRRKGIVYDIHVSSYNTVTYWRVRPLRKDGTASHSTASVYSDSAFDGGDGAKLVSSVSAQSSGT